MQQRFSIDTDHFQFYLEDISMVHDTNVLWDNAIGNQQLAVLGGLVAIATARWGQNTSVILELRQQPPATSDDTQWEQIAEASIETISGMLSLTTPEGDVHQAPQIAVVPGSYRVRVYYGNLSSVQDELAPQGADVYQLTIWPDRLVHPSLLKPIEDA